MLPGNITYIESSCWPRALYYVMATFVIMPMRHTVYRDQSQNAIEISNAGSQHKASSLHTAVDS